MRHAVFRQGRGRTSCPGVRTGPTARSSTSPRNGRARPRRPQAATGVTTAGSPRSTAAINPQGECRRRSCSPRRYGSDPEYGHRRANPPPRRSAAGRAAVAVSPAASERPAAGHAVFRQGGGNERRWHDRRRSSAFHHAGPHHQRRRASPRRSTPPSSTNRVTFDEVRRSRTVSSRAGTLAGTVNFFDGTAMIGSGTLGVKR